jgi:hypothetical protein
MPVPVRRLALGLVLGGTLLVGGALPATVAAQSCDPNYGATYAGCVPEDRDYDCPELHAMGLGDIPVIGSDWQRLDGYLDFATGQWVSYPDGLGCEWYGE